MINDAAYVLLGAGLLLFGSRMSEKSAGWIINIFGLILILSGIGVLPYAVPNNSFLPFAIMGSMVFFRGSSDFIKPIFGMSALVLFSMPYLTYGDVFSSEIIAIVVLMAIAAGAYVLITGRVQEQASYSPIVNEMRKPMLKKMLEVIDTPNSIDYD